MPFKRHGDRFARCWRTVRGVTLIELLIVVVIVAILAAIAYPNYRQYVQRSKRSEAMSALLRIATEQERYYLNENEYADKLTELGFDSDTFITGTETYSVSITNADAATYTAKASYQLTDEEAKKCNSFTIDARGKKLSEPDTDCWTSTR